MNQNSHPLSMVNIKLQALARKTAGEDSAAQVAKLTVTLIRSQAGRSEMEQESRDWRKQGQSTRAQFSELKLKSQSNSKPDQQISDFVLSPRGRTGAELLTASKVRFHPRNQARSGLVGGRK